MYVEREGRAKRERDWGGGVRSKEERDRETGEKATIARLMRGGRSKGNFFS